MSNRSKLEWTEAPWNPIVGFTKVSPGCKHGYADAMARRLQAIGVTGDEKGVKLRRLPNRLEEPLKRTKSTVYVVTSRSARFHEAVPTRESVNGIDEKASI